MDQPGPIDPPVSSQFDRLPPHDLVAEYALIGSMMLCDNDRELSAMASIVPAEAFFSIDNQIIYQRGISLAAKGIHPGALEIHSELLASGMLEEVGGVEQIKTILKSVPDGKQWRHYAGFVLRSWDRRRAISLSNDLLRDAYGGLPQETLEQRWQKASEALGRLAVARNDIKIQSMAEIVDAFLEERRRGDSPALLTGIEEWDVNFAGAFAYGLYTLVCALPSVGKSTLIRWLTWRWAKAGVPCGVIAVEEQAGKMAGNYLSCESSVPNRTVAYGHLNGELVHLEQAAERLKTLPWHCTDSAMKLHEVAAAFEKLVLDLGCKVIAIDHIHCIWPERGENENAQLTEISRTLKGLAKKHRVVMLVASQLKKPQTSGIPDAPNIQDIRSSGAMHQDADVVLGLHRPDAFAKAVSAYVFSNTCEVHHLKMRNANTGKVDLRAEMVYQRFSELEQPIPEFLR